MFRLTFISLLPAGLLVLSSCAESAHQVQRSAGQFGVPPELDQQIDRSVTFAELKAAPANYVGRVIMIGGIVIASKRTKVETELEVLELPTKSDGPSMKERHRSQGRFLAVREEFLDPASVPPGTPITVIGVVKGSVTKPLDETEYSYPVIDISHLVDWNAVTAQDSGGTFYGPYYPPYGYWGRPYGYYPYWGRPYPYCAPSRPSPRPPSRPPANIPPRFRRR